MPRKRRDSQMDLFARPAHPGLPETQPAERPGVKHASHLDGHQPIEGPVDKAGGYWAAKNWRMVRVDGDGVTVWQSLVTFGFVLQAAGQPDPWERPVPASPSGSPAAPAVQSADPSLSSPGECPGGDPAMSCIRQQVSPPEPRGTAGAEADPSGDEDQP